MLQEILTKFDPWLFVGALVFMLFDILSGFIAAVINKEVDSSKMRVGLLHKAVLIFVIVFSIFCQLAAEHFELPQAIDIVYPAVCLFIVCMEMISVLENVKKTGAFPEGALDPLFGNLGKNKGGEPDGGK